MNVGTPPVAMLKLPGGSVGVGGAAECDGDRTSAGEVRIHIGCARSGRAIDPVGLGNPGDREASDATRAGIGQIDGC